MKYLIIILFIVLSTEIYSQIEYGIICGDCPDKISAVKSTGSKWLRIPVELSTYTGKNILKKYYDSGINVIPTIMWSKGVDTFLRDTTKYKLMLDSFIKNNYEEDKLFLVICNEELNEFKNYGTAEDYINQLNAAITVASKYNLPIANGGLSFAVLKVGLYVSKMDLHEWDDANNYASLCIPPETIKKLQNPLFNMWIDIHFFDTIINGLSKISYRNFYTNFHYYAPALYRRSGDTMLIVGVTKDSVNIIKTTVDWLKDNTNRDSLHIICNEIGQFNTSPDLLRSELKNCERSNLKIVIWHGGDEPMEEDSDPVIAWGLFDSYSPIILRENGKTFKKIVSK